MIGCRKALSPLALLVAVLAAPTLAQGADHVTVDVVGKSYIAPIVVPSVDSSGYHGNGLGFEPDAAADPTKVATLISFAAQVNSAFSENPLDKPADDPARDRRDGTNGQYRIASFVRVEYDCVSGAVQNFHWSRRVADSGIELAGATVGAALIPPVPEFFSSPVQDQSQYLFGPGMADAQPGGDGISGSSIDFQYAIRGRPNMVAETFLQQNLGPRVNRYIAHVVVARVKCSGTRVLGNIVGTRFPTHALFVTYGSVSKVLTEPQLAFDSLWQNADATLWPSSLSLVSMRPDVISPTGNPP